jgi:hypothetical protein
MVQAVDLRLRRYLGRQLPPDTTKEDREQLAEFSRMWELVRGHLLVKEGT